jgi:hypothetical protein
MSLIDFKGFTDLRYTVLCMGTFFAILGLWVPSYYISTYLNPPSRAVHLLTDFENRTPTPLSPATLSASISFA